MNTQLLMFAAFVSGLALIPLMIRLVRSVSFNVEDETAVVVSSFGKMVGMVREPGFHFWPAKILPWTKVRELSLKRDFRTYESIHVNDCRGTTVVIDLWIEFRIVNPEKALFQIEDWERALQSLLTNSTTSILGTFEFNQILSNRSELSQTLKKDISDETSRWGLEIDLVFISKLSLLPDVSQQLFDTVAARLEKATADIEELGRLEAATLEAETAAKISGLVAEAKGQYALGVGRAYQRLSKNHELFAAYRELYDLSLMKPHRTIAFQGFGEQELSAIEAAMTIPSVEGASSGKFPQPLSAGDAKLSKENWRDIET